MDAEMEIDAPPAGQGPAVPVPVSAADAGDDTEDEDAEDETGNAGKDEMDVEPQKPQPRRAKALVDSDDEVADTPQADTATQKEADDDAAEKVLVKGGKKVVALADSDEEEEEGRAIPKRASQRASSAAPEEEEEDKESEDDLPIRRKGAKGRASRTAEAPDAEVEEEAGGGAKARGGQRRLVQRNDDATGSDSDGDAGAAAGGGAASPEVPQSKAEKRAEMEGMAAMARKRAEAQEPPKSKPKEAKKGTKRQEAKKAEEKEGSSKKSGKRGRGEAEPKKGAKTAKGKKGEGKSSTEGKELEAVLALMTRHLTNVIAKAVLEKDETLTKRVCRERLEEVFGDRVAANKAFVNEEVTRLIGAAQLLTEPELGAQLDTFVAVSTEEVEGVLAQLSSPVGKEDKGKKGAAKSSKGGTELEAVMALMTRHLTHVISQAVLEKDATLTKKVCRERLGEVFGDRVAENKAFVNEEVGRIVGAAQAMSEPDLGAQLDNFAAVSIEEVEGVRDQLAAAAFEAAAGAGSGSGSDSADSSSSEDEEPSHSKGGKSKGKRAASPSASDSASESEDDAPSRRKAKPKSKASRSGIFSGIVAVPAGDRMIRRVKELRGLVLEHGGKMQVAVTSKVYAPDIGAAASKKSDKRKAAAGSGDDDAGSAGGGEGGGDSSDGGSPKAKKRRAAKPRVESDWDKEFRSRFGYAKEARTRPFSYKDTVVPGATFFQDVAGQVYNAYLTQTEMPVAPQDEDEEEAEATTKFYAVKMVAAGGLMKGDKWHLVCQWGREGAEKPGCDVIDFSEEQECKAAFAKVFQEKTKNSWEECKAAFAKVFQEKTKNSWEASPPSH
ncbi:hypothetical protein T484DRAFT_1920692 [Baffinella frigidus]|nr:hypothetical protein T484DRAFT_1920692 [Cryptophyta sp. CCMP2293]